MQKKKKKTLANPPPKNNNFECGSRVPLYLQESASLNPNDATAVHGWESKRTKLTMLSG